MDDFEKAVNIAYAMDLTVSNEIKQSACDYCTNLRESPQGWRICLEKLHHWTASPEERGQSPVMSDYSKFFCLEVLNYCVSNMYSSLTTEDKFTFRRSILHFIQKLAVSGKQPHFLIGKLTTLLIAIVRQDFPDQWPTFFDDFLSVLAVQASGLSITIFLRMLIALEEDIIQSDPSFAITGKHFALTTKAHSQSVGTLEAQDEAALAMKIKDTLRVGALPRIVAAIHSIIHNFSQEHEKRKSGLTAQSSETFATEELTSLALNTLARYVQWIDINLVVNAQFFPLIYSLMDVPGVRESAVLFLTRICMKGMPAAARIQVFKHIRVVDILQRYNFAANELGNNSPNASSFSIAMARLLGAVGSQAVDAFNEIASPFVSGCQLHLQAVTRSSKPKSTIATKSIFNTNQNTSNAAAASAASSENDFLFSQGLNGFLSVLRGSPVPTQVPSTLSASFSAILGENSGKTDSLVVLGIQGASDISPTVLTNLANIYNSVATLSPAERAEKAEVMLELLRIVEITFKLSLDCFQNQCFELGREITPFLILFCALIRLPGVFPTFYHEMRDRLTAAIVIAIKFPTWYQYSPERIINAMRPPTGSSVEMSSSSSATEYEDHEEEFETYRSQCLERLLKLLAQVDKKFVLDYILRDFVQKHTQLVSDICRVDQRPPCLISVQDRTSGQEMEYDIALQTQSPLVSLNTYQGPNPETLLPTNSPTGHDLIKQFVHQQQHFRVQVSQMSQQSIANINAIPFALVEHPLRLMHILGEILGPNVLGKTSRNLWLGVFLTVLSTPLTYHRHPLVTAVVFDNISRYDKTIEACPTIVPTICQTFCDERGLHSAEYAVRARAAHCLLRFCKGLEEGARHILRGPKAAGTIIPVASAIVSARLARGLSTARASLALEDVVHLTEAMALLTSRAVYAAPSSSYLTNTGTADSQPIDLVASQAEFVNGFSLVANVVLQPFSMAVNSLSQWIKQDSGLTLERMCEFIALLTSLFRVLTPVDVTLPEIGGIVRKASEVVLLVLKHFPEDETLRTRSVALLHSLIEILKQHSIPICLEYLPILLEASTPTNIVVVLQLINNIICRFKTACTPIVSALFTPIVERIVTTINSFGDISKFMATPVVVVVPGPAGGNNKASTSKNEGAAALSHQRTLYLDVRRIFYTFLRDIFSNSIHTVLLEPANERAMMEALRLTQEGVSMVFDVSTIKSAIHILSQFIRLWQSEANKTQPPIKPDLPAQISNQTLRSFIILELLPRVTHIPFDNELNYRDANFMSLLREVINFHKIAFVALGDEYLKSFYDQLQLHLQMPPAPVESVVLLFQRNVEADVCVASLKDIIIAKRQEIEKLNR